MERTLPVSDSEREIDELRRLNEELKNDLVESATVGQNILSRNNELEEQLREQGEYYSAKQETLEQDNYVLRSKLETQTKLVEEQFQELERWKSDVQEARKSKLEQDKLGAHHTKVVERLESEVAALQAELDNSRLVESALQEKVERQEALLSQWREQENSNSSFSGLESEVGTLQTTVAVLEREKETLTLKLHDAESQLKVLRSSDTASKAKVASLQEELEEHLEEANSLRTALQCANEKSAECAQELQMLKLEMMGEAAGQRGNSLFSEVEDRRLETEKRFISLRVKHESLEKAHAVAQQQLKKLKVSSCPNGRWANPLPQHYTIQPLHYASTSPPTHITASPFTGHHSLKQWVASLNNKSKLGSGVHRWRDVASSGPWQSRQAVLLANPPKRGLCEESDIECDDSPALGFALGEKWSKKTSIPDWEEEDFEATEAGELWYDHGDLSSIYTHSRGWQRIAVPWVCVEEEEEDGCGADDPALQPFSYPGSPSLRSPPADPEPIVTASFYYTPASPRTLPLEKHVAWEQSSCSKLQPSLHKEAEHPSPASLKAAPVVEPAVGTVLRSLVMMLLICSATQLVWFVTRSLLDL